MGLMEDKRVQMEGGDRKEIKTKHDQDSDTTKFQDWKSETFGFDSFTASLAKEQKNLKEHSVQTDPIEFIERSVQTAILKSTEVQTEDVGDAKVKYMDPKDYPPTLFNFFKKVTDEVCEILEENLDPFGRHLFDKYASSNERAEDETKPNCLFKLKSSNVQNGFEGSCLSWSKSGNQLAIGYRFNHSGDQGWCCHTTPLSVWNLSRREVNPGTPHVEINFESCITSLEFHPTDLSILAVGLLSGSVAIVDLSSADSTSVILAHDPITCTQSSGHFGGEITSLQWIRVGAKPLPGSYIEQTTKNHRKSYQKETKIENKSPYCLVSGGKDGYICVWRANKANTRIELEKRFLIWSPSLQSEVPEGIVGNFRSKLSGIREVGVTCLSASKDDPTQIVISTFGSVILVGNLASEVLIDSENEIPELTYNPVSYVLNFEKGYIESIDCSLFSRNLCLSSSLDGHLLISTLLQPYTPVLEISLAGEDVTSMTGGQAKWSPCRQMLIGCVHRNNLSFFDLLANRIEPELIILNDCELKKLAFNKVNSQLVATCDVNGYTSVWKLPLNISIQRSREMDALLELETSIFQEPKFDEKSQSEGESEPEPEPEPEEEE